MALKKPLVTSDGTLQELAAPDALDPSSLGSNVRDRVVGVVIDNGNNPITTGLKGFIEVPFAGTVVGWKLIASAVGSAVVDIWKANADIPSVANTITAAAKPVLSSQQRASSTTLTGWTTAVVADDCFAFNIDSTSGINRLTVELIIRTS